MGRRSNRRKFTGAPRGAGVTSRSEASSSEWGTLFRRPQKLRPLHHLVLWLSLTGALPTSRGDDFGCRPKLACRPRRADVAGQPQELANFDLCKK